MNKAPDLYTPCPGIGAWAVPVTRQNLPISDTATFVEVASDPLPPSRDRLKIITL
jgi:hypothetical protein